MSRTAAIYCRMSRDREGAGLGVDRQRADCQALADRLGWTVAATYDDNDISAYSGKPRPGYRAMLGALEDGTVTAVIAWHTDRLHRSPRELEEYVDVCDKHGVATHTVKAGPLDLSTPSGRMVARQLGAVARFEVEHAIERAQRAKLQAATAGRWKGGRRAFGYASDGVTVVPGEAAAIIEATDAVLAGASLHGIARDWNAAGVATSAGGTWKPSELRRVLTRPRNAGLMQHRGEVIGEAEWAAIVDEDRWRAVVGLLNDPQRRTSPGSERRWLGSGLYLCGICDDKLICTTSGKTTARESTPAYRCRSRKHVTRNAEHLDDHVGKIIIARLAREDVNQLLTASETGDRSAELHGEAVSLRARLDELAGLYADGAVTARQLKDGTERIRARLEDVERRIGVLSRRSALDGFAGRDPKVVWDGLDLSRQRAVLDTLVTVTVLPAKVGRHPGGAYFDPDAVAIEWRR